MSRDLVHHVGCGSVDEGGRCPLCDEIRRILEAALVDVPAPQEQDAYFDDWASHIVDGMVSKSNDQLEWEIVEALQKAYCRGARYDDRAYEDIARTPFEAFGHNETCGRWVEGPTSIHLDRHQPCTCGGVELHPDGDVRLLESPTRIGPLTPLGPGDPAPTRPVDRLMLNAYGRRCYDAGRQAASQASPWQAIETAPKDGERILGVNIHWGTVRVTWWDDPHQTWASFPLGVTHWIPLPSPPVLADAQRTGIETS